MDAKGFTLRELAALVNGTVQGDDSTLIKSVAKLDQAGPWDLAFCTSDRYLADLAETKAGAVLVKEDYAHICGTTAVIVRDPYHAFARISSSLYPRERKTEGVHATALVDESAIVEEGVYIGPGAVVGSGVFIGRNSEIGANAYLGAGAKVGAESWLAPGVCLGEKCSLGQRAIIHAGVVIGADGFGFAPGEGGWQKIPQLGGVNIGDDVEIGANSTVDRGALEDTCIGNGVKLDNLVHVAHNVHIGNNTVIAGCTVIAGSTTIGNNCVIGGQSAITGHIEICDGVTIMGMTSVTGAITEPGVYSSPIPARPVRQWRKNAVRFTQLDDMFRRLSSIERHIEAQHNAVVDH